MAPPRLQKVVSFSLDIDDWYSCTSSDDEAYQEALERNSSASFYTARGAASSAASVVHTSVAPGSPTRLADADRALEEMVPEPLSDPRLLHEPPEMDEEEVPASKRTRNTLIEPSPAVLSSAPAMMKSSPKNGSRRTTSSRVASTCAFEGESSWLALAPTSQSLLCSPQALRVSISVQPDNSVQLHVSPAVFCFGNINLPAPSNLTDYSAMLLGPDGGLSAEDSSMALGDSICSPRPAQPASPTALSDDRVIASPPVRSPTHNDSRSYKDPITPKDQTKIRRQAEGKERKSGGFPGSFILQRLFSGLRSSRVSASTDSLPPVTAQELGAELLLASTAGATASLELAAAAVGQAPIIACYVHAATSSPSRDANDSALDEASAAAHRLSADIFRNVLRASAGGAAAAGSCSPKPFTSPRDTAFTSLETPKPKRDQITLGETTPCRRSPPASAGRPVPSSGINSPQHLHDDGQQEPAGEAALALLVGLAADNAPEDVGASEGLEALKVGEPKEQAPPDATCPKDSTAFPSVHERAGSDEVLDGADLPTLEQCDSPIAAESGPISPEAAGSAAADLPEPAMSTTLTPSAVMETAKQSPRTLSKKAYGTIARLVQKLAPNYRDSTVKSIMADDMVNSPLKAQAAELRVPSADAENGLVTVPQVPSETASEEVAANITGPVADDAPGITTAGDPGAPSSLSQSSSSPMFVFGQGRPKGSKHNSSKTRLATKKDATPAPADAVVPLDPPGRKRKADLEILPSAKLPLMREAEAATASLRQIDDATGSMGANVEVAPLSQVMPSSCAEPAAPVSAPSGDASPLAAAISDCNIAQIAATPEPQEVSLKVSGSGSAAAATPPTADLILGEPAGSTGLQSKDTDSAAPNADGLAQQQTTGAGVAVVGYGGARHAVCAVKAVENEAVATKPEAAEDSSPSLPVPTGSHNGVQMADVIPVSLEVGDAATLELDMPVVTAEQPLWEGPATDRSHATTKVAEQRWQQHSGPEAVELEGSPSVNEQLLPQPAKVDESTPSADETDVCASGPEPYAQEQAPGTVSQEVVPPVAESHSQIEVALPQGGDWDMAVAKHPSRSDGEDAPADPQCSSESASKHPLQPQKGELPDLPAPEPSSSARELGAPVDGQNTDSSGTAPVQPLTVNGQNTPVPAEGTLPPEHAAPLSARTTAENLSAPVMHPEESQKPPMASSLVTDAPECRVERATVRDDEKNAGPDDPGAQFLPDGAADKALAVSTAALPTNSVNVEDGKQLRGQGDACSSSAMHAEAKEPSGKPVSTVDQPVQAFPLPSVLGEGDLAQAKAAKKGKWVSKMFGCFHAS